MNIRILTGRGASFIAGVILGGGVMLLCAVMFLLAVFYRPSLQSTAAATPRANVSATRAARLAQAQATTNAISIATLTPIPTTPTPAATPTATTVTVVLTDNVNVRAAPSTQAKILGKLRKDTRVTVSRRSADGQWWQITYPTGSEQTGFIAVQYTMMLEAAPMAPVAEVVSAGGAGLGVSRDQARAAFEKLGFAFANAAEVAGQPHLSSKSHSGEAVLDLIGPTQDLTSVSLSFSVSQSDAGLSENVANMIKLLALVTPDWAEGPKWLSDNFRRAMDGAVVKTTRGHIEIVLTVDKQQGTVDLAVRG